MQNLKKKKQNKNIRKKNDDESEITETHTY